MSLLAARLRVEDPSRIFDPDVLAEVLAPFCFTCWCRLRGTELRSCITPDINDLVAHSFVSTYVK